MRSPYNEFEVIEWVEIRDENRFLHNITKSAYFSSLVGMTSNDLEWTFITFVISLFIIDFQRNEPDIFQQNLTGLRCRWQNCVIFFWCWCVILLLRVELHKWQNLFPTSQNWHQLISCPKSVTNIIVADSLPN